MEMLAKVQSICPQCKKILEAAYVEDGGRVFIEKTCPDHGLFRVPVAEKVDDYLKWTERPVINIPPPVALTEGEEGRCPLNCGPCQHHLQTTCCVLIDVTQRCNQHCPYCFAVAGDGEAREPDLEEMERKFDLLLELGEKEFPYNIQLSGGEPTVRDDLPEIVSMAKRKGFNYIQLNTNGRRLAEEPGYAEKLKQAGVSVAFMQFDGVTDDVYLKLRSEPLLEIKKKAIDNCRRAGLAVTLVPTVVRGVNLDQVGDMVRFLLDNVDVVKGIHFQPVSFFGRHPGGDAETEGRVTMFDVLHAIEEQTEGFHYEDFCPITTGHTLCCFYSTYLKQGDKVVCQVSSETKQNGASCCCTTVDQDPMEIIKKDRNYVVNQWDMGDPVQSPSCCCGGDPEPAEEPCCCGGDPEPAEEPCCCGGDPEPETEESCYCGGEEEPMDLDEFIEYYKKNSFTLTGMAFMDGSNLDAERLKRCRVVQLTDDDKLVPFCAYNSIYRGEEL
ncbi:MAG: radical SAM protein [Anaerovoracaceae bacterium]|jgi:uncharacterized radical SAM superfamily Fe-S cluster-containing enzyme